MRKLMLFLLLAVLAVPAISLAQTGAMFGTVSDAQGNLLAGAVVALRPQFPGPLAGCPGRPTPPVPPLPLTAITDENGYYRIENIPVGAYYAAAAYQGLGHTVQEVVIEEGAELEVNFVIEGWTPPTPPPPPPQGSAVMFGLVTDVDGNPVAGAFVALFPPPQPPSWFFSGSYQPPQPPPIPPFHAITDENGAYRIEGIPAGTYLAHAAKCGVGHAEQEVTFEEGAELEVNFVLQGGPPTPPPQGSAVMFGVVTDAEGNPLAGAFVALFPPMPQPLFGLRGDHRPPQRPPRPPFHAITDENGAYRIEGIPAGEYVARAVYRGLGYAEQPVAFEEGQELEVNFVIQGETPPVEVGSMFGVVTDAEGNPVADAIVAVIPARRGGPRTLGFGPMDRFFTKTAEDGSYLLENIPVGHHFAVAFKRGVGFAFAEVDILAEQATEVNFTLERRPPPPEALLNR